MEMVLNVFRWLFFGFGVAIFNMGVGSVLAGCERGVCFDYPYQSVWGGGGRLYLCQPHGPSLLVAKIPRL
jgi:hypothetical protein